MARILVADDSPRARASLRGVLEKAGHDVETAENGKVAVSLCRKRAPDLVIVDLVMPEMDGLETISELRREAPDARIIATCGDTRLPAEVGLRTALALGARCALKKPISPARVLRALFELLGTLPAVPSSSSGPLIEPETAPAGP